MKVVKPDKYEGKYKSWAQCPSVGVGKHMKRNRLHHKSPWKGLEDYNLDRTDLKMNIEKKQSDHL